MNPQLIINLEGALENIDRTLQRIADHMEGAQVQQQDGVGFIAVADKHPPVGMPLMFYHPDWVCADFNPNGIREGFWNCNGTPEDWTSARWNNDQDCYMTDHQKPTHWAYQAGAQQTTATAEIEEGEFEDAGEHYCQEHQGNHSHYDPVNCRVCKLVEEADRYRKALGELDDRCARIEFGEGHQSGAQQDGATFDTDDIEYGVLKKAYNDLQAQRDGVAELIAVCKRIDRAIEIRQHDEHMLHKEFHITDELREALQQLEVSDG